MTTQAIVSIDSRVTKVVQLYWANWASFCEATGDLISRKNEARSVDFYHADCGDKAGPWIEVTLTADRSHDGQEYTINHGDYVVVLENGKLVRVNYLNGIAALAEVISQSLALGTRASDIDGPADFVFNVEDFPFYRKWVHRNGNHYIILSLTNIRMPARPGYPATINYVNAHTGEPYSGPAWDWHRRMTLVG